MTDLFLLSETLRKEAKTIDYNVMYPTTQGYPKKQQTIWVLPVGAVTKEMGNKEEVIEWVEQIMKAKNLGELAEVLTKIKERVGGGG